MLIFGLGNGSSSDRLQHGKLLKADRSIDMVNEGTATFYRGGSNFEAKPYEVRVDPETNYVKPTHGISIHQDADRVRSFGGAYKIVFLPHTLKCVQRGRDRGHYEIVPREANLLTYEQYLDELRKIQAVLEEE